MKLQLNLQANPNTEFLENLTVALQESGIQIVSQDGDIEMVLGDAGMGFSQQEIVSIEKRLVERFHGAELFLHARTTPFARIRCGLTENGRLLVASPLDSGLSYRLARLMQQYRKLSPQTIPERMGLSEQVYTPPDTKGISIQQKETVHPPVQPPPKHGWMLALDELQGQFIETPPTIPDSLNSNPAAQNVLNTTYAQRTVITTIGEVYGAYGFPDLLRPTSKVLLVSADGGVVALHRTRQPTGIVSDGTLDILNIDIDDVDGISKQRTGKIAPRTGKIFALNGNTVYFHIENYIVSWDGKKERKEGTQKQVTASLLLQWSQR